MSQSLFTFRGQRDGERVLLVIHRHPWALAKQSLITAVGLVLIILMFVWFQASRPAMWTFFVVGSLCLVYAVHSWYIWWNNLYLITDQRVIVIVHRALWSRRIEDYGLDKIQSVASDTHGLAPAILNFGTLMLAIIGIKEQIQLPYIEDTYAVQEKLLAAIKEVEQGSTARSRRSDDRDGGRKPKRVLPLR